MQDINMSKYLNISGERKANTSMYTVSSSQMFPQTPGIRIPEHLLGEAFLALWDQTQGCAALPAQLQRRDMNSSYVVAVLKLILSLNLAPATFKNKTQILGPHL